MFFTRPVGTYVLQVCRTLSCALNGAERVTDAICKHLHVRPGETDATGTFTVQEFECLGACDRAPVIMVNNEHWHEHQRPEDVPRFLDDLRRRGLGALSGCHLVPAGEREHALARRAVAKTATMAQFEPVLTRYVKEPGSYTLDFYLQHGGYEAMRKAAVDDARGDHRRAEEVGPARPRRRRLPDRHEVGLRARRTSRSRSTC